MSILVGGSVAIDNVKTPSADEKGLLGGSASYAALAAAKLASPVHLLGIVGHDFPASHITMLEGNGVDLGGLEHSSEESFTWSGEYHENMNERTTHNVAINVLEHWEVKVPDVRGLVSLCRAGQHGPAEPIAADFPVHGVGEVRGGRHHGSLDCHCA